MPVSKASADYAPILVFAYNRVDCLENLLRSLERNNKTRQMELFIFIDIPRSGDKKNMEYNKSVIEFAYDYKKECRQFMTIQVIVADKHKGLANSIITGVSQIINKYGKVIVLEDDLIVSDDFLDYMQRGLNFYYHNERVWELAAYSADMRALKVYQKDVFLALRPESWGWGTWKDRWNRVDWNVNSYSRFKKDWMGQFLFNLGGNDLCGMLELQMKDETFDSWAIRWGYHQFLERKYTVYPRESRVIHCGNDDRSTHIQNMPIQRLKGKYERCVFEDVKVNPILLFCYRKVNSEPIGHMIKETLRLQIVKGKKFIKKYGKSFYIFKGTFL